jgi:tellurite resistance protein
LFKDVKAPAQVCRNAYNGDMTNRPEEPGHGTARMSSVRAHSGPDLQDIALYLRGLVQMMAADHALDAGQRERVLSFAARHGFDAGYVEAAIASVLANAHFPLLPPRFNHRATAEEFLREAAVVALCDGALHPREREWLLEAARHNDVEEAVVLEVLGAFGAAAPLAGAPQDEGDGRTS